MFILVHYFFFPLGPFTATFAGMHVHFVFTYTLHLLDNK